MSPTPSSETDAKWERVRGHLDARGLHGVFLSTRANFAWATGGGDNHVGLATEIGASTLFVSRERRVVVADGIETPRLRAEEIRGERWEFSEFPWHDGAARAGILRGLADGRPVESDAPMPGVPLAGPDLAALRYVLLPEEIERYRWLGREASLALEGAGHGVRPGDTESAIAASIAARLLPKQIEPVVLLVAADERISSFRHPIPTARPVRRCAMLVVCARRYGLIASLTRLVHFGLVDSGLARRNVAAQRGDASLVRATLPGVRWRDALQSGIDAYAREGFEGEWRHHHQGGPTGYAGREFRATPGEARTILERQAFAWNPSIAGTKSEDTFLALPAGPEPLTAPQEWPSREVDGLDRAEILVL